MALRIGAFPNSDTREHSTDILEIQRGLYFSLEQAVEEMRNLDYILSYTMKGLF